MNTTSTVEHNTNVHQKLRMELSQDPAVPLLACIQRKLSLLPWYLCSHSHTTQFTIAQTQTQCKCPSVDKCLKKMWSLYTMKYQLSIKEISTVICQDMKNLDNMISYGLS